MLSKGGALLRTLHATSATASWSRRWLYQRQFSQLLTSEANTSSGGACCQLRHLATAAHPTSGSEEGPFYDSVIKINSTSLRANYFQPWQLRGQSESSGSGFAIAGNLILTNAHVVADTAFSTCKRQGSSERYKCAVKAVSHECDLALLIVEDPRFWQEPSPVRALPLGDVPHLNEEIIVVGYPTGGSNICVTAGVVSRVGMSTYAHAGTNLLAVQIDAAINPGNSGGPALQDGRVVGVAFQDLEGGENVGYIIPVPVIQHFLEEVQREGRYRGTSSLGLRCQALENSAARRALGMAPGQTGVLVVSVLPTGAAASHVQPGDVLLSFNGTPIANDGTVLFRRRERISFEHLVTLTVPGDAAMLGVLREGREVECTVRPRPLSAPVPQHMFDRRPSYYIFGGLVFMPLTQPYLHEWGEEGGESMDWQSKCPQNLHHLAMNAEAQEPGQQVIILSQVLADDVNFGYGRLENLQLLAVDGVPVKNLAHLVEMVEGGSSSNSSRSCSSNSSRSSRSSSEESKNDGSNCGGSGDCSSSCISGADSLRQGQQRHRQQQEDGGNGAGGGSAVRGQYVRGQYVRFTLEKNQVVILDRQEAAEALPRILDTHRVPERCSRDLLPLVGEGPQLEGPA